MGTARTLAGWLCVGALAGCTTGSSTDLRSDDDAADLEAAQNTNLPPPPPNGTCALIQRGTLGQVQDTDIGFGDGADYPMGNTPYSWTGVSPYDHWSAYKFDLAAIPANATVVLGLFSSYVQWNEHSATIRAHRIVGPWDEGTATWRKFTANGTQTNWDPTVVGSAQGAGVGFRSFDVTALVQQWQAGAAANNGLLLEEDPVSLHGFFTSEASSVNLRPSLYVCWIPAPACGQNNAECAGLTDCCDGLACQNGLCAPLGPPDGDGDGVPAGVDCDDENPLVGALLYENDMSVDTSYLANGPKLTAPWAYHDGVVSNTKGGQQALLGQAEGWTDTVTFLSLSAHGSKSGCSSDAPDCQPERFRAGVLARSAVDGNQDEGYAGYRCAVAQNAETDCYDPGPFVQLAAFLSAPEDDIQSECTTGCPPNPTFDQLDRTNRSAQTDLLSGAPATLTFWAVGSQLVCAFDGAGGEHVVTSATDERFAAGGTGLSTLNALGDFDHVKVCQAFGTPVCGQVGQACGANQPCCEGLCNDGVCSNGGGPGGGDPPPCSAVGSTCASGAECCGGACADGLCVATDQCVGLDGLDADGNLVACEAAHPCCGDTHCIGGMCWSDGFCKTPGAACDPDNDSCCWGLACMDGTCQ